MKRSGVLLLAFLCIFAGGNVLCNLQLKKSRDTIKLKFKSPQSRAPIELTEMLAGEFHGVLSDFLLLEIGSFIGSDQKGTYTDYHNIYRTLKTIFALDPYYKQAYLYTQALLPWKAAEPELANALLAIPKASRTWDWRPGYYMAFNNYYFMGDYTKASELLLEAGEIKDAPKILAVLGARFAMKAKRSEAAIFMLEDMLKDDKLKENDRKEITMRIAALKGVLVLEDAIQRYHRRYNAFPQDLNSLEEEQLIRGIPQNPYGESFLYDPATGEVKFDQNK